MAFRFFRQSWLYASGVIALAGQIVLLFGIATGLLFVSPVSVADRLHSESDLQKKSDLQNSIATDEYAIKAAYIYNILKFVRWPAQLKKQAGASFMHLCIYGDNPFAPAVLDGLEDNIVQGYRLRISLIAVGQADATQCHAVFIAVDDNAERQSAIAAFQHKGLLTLGDAEGFAKSGGMVGFVTEKKAVRFELNLTQAKAQGVTFSSQLAETAREVF